MEIHVDSSLETGWDLNSQGALSSCNCAVPVLPAVSTQGQTGNAGRR